VTNGRTLAVGRSYNTSKAPVAKPLNVRFVKLPVRVVLASRRVKLSPTAKLHAPRQFSASTPPRLALPVMFSGSTLPSAVRSMASVPTDACV
jgi:hypothetical protein